MLNGLDLFSGIGGISLALKDYVRPIAYCEINSYCQSVLLSQMARGNIRTAPIWDDITALDAGEFESEVDVIYGGFPCQDISTLGHGKGLEGERSGLFFEIVRISNEIHPTFIFLENVPAITSKGGVQVVKEITKMGYDARWITITANSVGALHKRERWFLLAHSNRKPSRQADTCSKSKQSEGRTWVRPTGQDRGETSKTYWKENKCPLLGMDDGLPFELDRAKGLGNAVVPQQTKEAFEILMGIKKATCYQMTFKDKN
jgi:DNA (cytosine-5)-methyltransferase 1